MLTPLPRRPPRLHRECCARIGLRADIAARKTLKVIPVSPDTQRISISNDDHWVFTSDQTEPRLAVIDTTTNKLRRWIPLEGIGYGSAPTTDGRWLLLAIPNKNSVAVIDLKTMRVARSVAAASLRRRFWFAPTAR